MKVLGIISEYNPLHSGHVHHIRASLEKTDASHIVCVMSGQFVQRGEPAIVDKWARTRMALMAGVDLVFELPTAFACASAEFFAYGAVRLLHQTGIVDCLSFGSELGDIEPLQLIAKVLLEEPSPYKTYLKKFLSEGLSFPAAREKAMICHLGKLCEGIAGKSNNILAIEYLKALMKLKSSIQPVTIKRQGSDYQSAEIKSRLSSATAIRRFIENGGSVHDALLTDNLPDSTQIILNECFKNKRGPVFPADFSDIILHRIRTISPEALRNSPDVSEGLENRIIASAMSTGDLDSLLESVATTRYPATRIKRIASRLLWGITKNSLREFIQDDSCGYLRILGFNEKGRELLGYIHKEASVPLVAKASNFNKQLQGLSKEMFIFDIKATDSYVLAFSDKSQRMGEQDFTTPVIRM